MSQILQCLILGEFQQMTQSERSDTSSERFQRYLRKTFNKTASLMAYSCQSVAYLSLRHMERLGLPSRDESHLPKSAYNYGKNVGIAFQLVDDWLDFSADATQLGKPAAADLEYVSEYMQQLSESSVKCIVSGLVWQPPRSFLPATSIQASWNH